MPIQELDPFEVVATGNLYKRHLVRSAWSERKVTLCGQYLYQYSKSNVYRGRFLVTDCSVNIVDPEAGIVPPGFFGFVLTSSDRSVTFCAASKKELALWITVITDQVAEYQDDLRIHLKRGELIVGNNFVRVVKSPDSYDSSEVWCDGSVSVRLIVTTFPRFFFVDLPGDSEDSVVEDGLINCCVPSFGFPGYTDAIAESVFSVLFAPKGIPNSSSDDSLQVRKMIVTKISKEQRSWDKLTHPNVVELSGDSLEVSFLADDADSLRVRYSSAKSTASTVNNSASSISTDDAIDTYAKKNSFIFIDEINGSSYWSNVFSDLKSVRLLSTDRGAQSTVIQKDKGRVACVSRVTLSHLGRDREHDREQETEEKEEEFTILDVDDAQRRVEKTDVLQSNETVISPLFGKPIAVPSSKPLSTRSSVTIRDEAEDSGDVAVPVKKARTSSAAPKGLRSILKVTDQSTQQFTQQGQATVAVEQGGEGEAARAAKLSNALPESPATMTLIPPLTAPTALMASTALTANTPTVADTVVVQGTIQNIEPSLPGASALESIVQPVPVSTVTASSPTPSLPATPVATSSPATVPPALTTSAAAVLRLTDAAPVPVAVAAGAVAAVTVPVEDPEEHSRFVTSPFIVSNAESVSSIDAVTQCGVGSAAVCAPESKVPSESYVGSEGSVAKGLVQSVLRENRGQKSGKNGVGVEVRVGQGEGISDGTGAGSDRVGHMVGVGVGVGGEEVKNTRSEVIPTPDVAAGESIEEPVCAAVCGVEPAVETVDLDANTPVEIPKPESAQRQISEGKIDMKSWRLDPSLIDLNIRPKVESRASFKTHDTSGLHVWSDKDVFLRNWDNENYKMASSGIQVEADYGASNPLNNNNNENPLNNNNNSNPLHCVSSDRERRHIGSAHRGQSGEVFLKDWDNNNYKACSNGVLRSFNSSSRRASNPSVSRIDRGLLLPFEAKALRDSVRCDNSEYINGRTFLRSFDNSAYKNCGNGAESDHIGSSSGLRSSSISHPNSNPMICQSEVARDLGPEGRDFKKVSKLSVLPPGPSGLNSASHSGPSSGPKYGHYSGLHTGPNSGPNSGHSSAPNSIPKHGLNSTHSGTGSAHSSNPTSYSPPLVSPAMSIPNNFSTKALFSSQIVKARRASQRDEDDPNGLKSNSSESPVRQTFGFKGINDEIPSQSTMDRKQLALLNLELDSRRTSRNLTNEYDPSSSGEYDAIEIRNKLNKLSMTDFEDDEGDCSEQGSEQEQGHGHGHGGQGQGHGHGGQGQGHGGQGQYASRRNSAVDSSRRVEIKDGVERKDNSNNNICAGNVPINGTSNATGNGIGNTIKSAILTEQDDPGRLSREEKANSDKPSALSDLDCISNINNYSDETKPPQSPEEKKNPPPQSPDSARKKSYLSVFFRKLNPIRRRPSTIGSSESNENNENIK